MNYLFDLDVITALFEEESPFHEAVENRIKHLEAEDNLYLSLLSLYELQYSLSNTDDQDIQENILRLIDWCKDFFDILPLSESGAEFYGSLKAGLRKKTGMNRKAIKKHNIDIMLAATALEHDCVLVAIDGIYTNHLTNMNKQLRVENWTDIIDHK